MGGCCSAEPRQGAGAAAAAAEATARRVPGAHGGEAVTALCAAGPGRLLSGGDDRRAGGKAPSRAPAAFGARARSGFGALRSPVSPSRRRRLVLVDWASGRTAAQWAGASRAVSRVAYAPGAGLALCASRDAAVRAYREGEAKPVLTLDAHRLVVTGFAVSEARGLVATGSRDYHVKLWDLATGGFVRGKEVSRNVITSMAWCDGEDALAQASEDLRVRVWDTRTLEVAQTFEGHTDIPLCVAAHQDGVHLLTCSHGFDSHGCEVRLWDRRTGGLVRSMEGHSESVASCCFLPNPDGRLLCATGSADRTVRVWDARSGTCEAVESFRGDGEGGDAPVTAVAALDADPSSWAWGVERHERQLGLVAAGNFGGASHIWGVAATEGASQDAGLRTPLLYSSHVE